MNFVNRLKYFAVGIGLGCMLVYFFFGNRSCAGWLPENRVKHSLLNHPYYTSKKTQCFIKKNGYSDSIIAEIVLNGEVDFDASIVNRNPKVYTITLQKRLSYYLEMSFDPIDSLVFVNEFRIEKHMPCEGNFDIRNNINTETILEKLLPKNLKTVNNR